MGKKTEELRTCQTCIVAMPLSAYPKDPKSVLGHRFHCLACFNARRSMKKYRTSTTPVVPVPNKPVERVHEVIGVLPDPTKLPAIYLKECYDLWKDLQSDEPRKARVA